MAFCDQEDDILVHFTEKTSKQIETFLQENVSEIIRTNVITAPRIFDRRVNIFVKEYMLGNTAGMQVEFYSYKVEFQQRGAGHVHSVLWLMTDVLEWTEWIKETDNNQIRGQTEPKVPVVSETLPNEEVKVYTEEDLSKTSQEKKDQMNLPVQDLKELFENSVKREERWTHSESLKN